MSASSAGTSRGVLNAYSLGTDGLRDQRLGRGEITARWVLSPGVPIVAVCVDESYNQERKTRDRVCVVVLNALGEVFYLSDLPRRRSLDRAAKLDERSLDRLAWETGRTVRWSLVEPSRRQGRVDPFDTSGADPSYSPWSSWAGMGLTKEQLAAETREIEAFLRHKPSHFRKVCDGWDLQRRLEADFASDDGHDAGESVVVVSCGLEQGLDAGIQRFTRCHDPPPVSSHAQRMNSGSQEASVFGSTRSVNRSAVRSPVSGPQSRTSSRSSSAGVTGRGDRKIRSTHWRTTSMVFEPHCSEPITATALDMSTFAVMAAFEDPLLGMCGSSATSSPSITPSQQHAGSRSLAEIPGHRARLVAAGTKTGSILLWDIRAPTSSSAELVNTISPLRVIRTDSPQISTLGLTALYLIHGGNDGLVQAWDPLASNLQPIRTLNSRFSTRARRRLVQAEGSPQGVGVNLFAAGAICLDPDPTVLRGVVSLGTHLRYWSYSSSAADPHSSRKRRLRRSDRGGNGIGEKVTGTGRGTLSDYITNETVELQREKETRQREANRLASRFGIGLLGHGASEEDVLEYARMLSQETFAQDEERRRSESDEISSQSLDGRDDEANLDERGVADDMDVATAEAIRLSLEEVSLAEGDAKSGIPFKYVRGRQSPSSSPRGSGPGARE